MDLMATPFRRKVLFACLYFSEGAPIGFIWLALPTRLRDAGVPIDQITFLTAIVVIPWTFKFAWAPLVDILRTSRWTLRHWIMSAQLLMGSTLLPLAWLDLRQDFYWVVGILLLHAVAAATQDVAIDALCISVTNPEERGQYNGWMQTGMLLGRASLGGGALLLAHWIGDTLVVGLLVLVTMGSLSLVGMARLPHPEEEDTSLQDHLPHLLLVLQHTLRQANIWFGLLFALFGGASFKSLEVMIGPLLIDRGFAKSEVGLFASGPMIVPMVLGALAGGWLADRLGRRRFVFLSLLFIVAMIGTAAAIDQATDGRPGRSLPLLLAATAFGIGLFTSASYAMFMDITQPAIAATQFSALMGATNGCEAWSSYAVGQIVAARGYPTGLFAMCGVSLLALPLLLGIGPPRLEAAADET